MRLAFHGYKGGVGKSTLSLMLAKALAEEGLRVLFIDRDTITWASELAGIKDDGLITQLSIGKEPKNFSREFKVGKGTLEILKMFSSGINFYKAMQSFDKGEEFKKFYIDYLKSKKFDHIILDNPILLSWEHNPIKYETLAFKELYPNEKSYVVLVSEPFQFSVEDSIIYLKRISAESPIDWIPFTVIINMTIGDKEKCRECLKKIMDSFKFIKGVIIGFYDSLFQFYGDVEKLPIIPEIRILTKRIIDNDMRQEIIV